MVGNLCIIHTLIHEDICKKFGKLFFKSDNIIAQKKVNYETFNEKQALQKSPKYNIRRSTNNDEFVCVEGNFLKLNNIIKRRKRLCETFMQKL